jgi:hypothetical protein
MKDIDRPQTPWHGTLRRLSIRPSVRLSVCLCLSTYHADVFWTEDDIQTEMGKALTIQVQDQLIGSQYLKPIIRARVVGLEGYELFEQSWWAKGLTITADTLIEFLVANLIRYLN